MSYSWTQNVSQTTLIGVLFKYKLCYLQAYLPFQRLDLIYGLNIVMSLTVRM